MPIRLVYNHIPRLTIEMQRQASNVVRTAGRRVEQISKASMSGAKHGRVYRRGKRTHRASAPGEAPAVDTGKLKNSIETKMVTPLRAQVIASAKYAIILETKMKRRFFKPAVEQIRDWFGQAMANAIGRVK